jgi:hypothetical protein
MRKFLIFILFIVVITGCNAEISFGRNTGGNPTAEEVLKMNPNASILMYNNIIYQSGIDWVNELELTKDKQITKIIEQRVDGNDFDNGTANKLIAGTKIFSVKENNNNGILIAETKDGDIRFYSLIEG